MVIMKWTGVAPEMAKVWLIADIGKERDRLPGRGAELFYKAQSSGSAPPAAGWEPIGEFWRGFPARAIVASAQLQLCTDEA